MPKNSENLLAFLPYCRMKINRTILRIVIHTTVWVVYATHTVFFYEPAKIAEYGLWTLLVKQVTFYIGMAIVFYSNYAFLIPRFFAKRQFVRYAVGVLCSFVAAYLVELLHGYILSVISGNMALYQSRIPLSYSFVFYSVFFTAISFAVRSAQQWFENQKIQDDLHRAHIDLLTLQISPHFLFNTLNNIYLLVLRKDEKAATSVLMLSDLLRYTLYQDMRKKIPVQKELQHMENFIALQQLRIVHPEIVSYTVQGNSEQSEIYPLLLLPFVENVFKHGDFHSPETYARIAIDYTDTSIHLSTENIVHEAFKDTARGIGIANVRDRLEHFYPGAYTLNVRNVNHVYSVQLRIALQ